MHFVDDDRACAMGAVAAGCRFCSYYPITPASEIAEAMAEMLPRVGGIALQMEDEIGSMHSANGASVAGLKAMTATSGPGCSVHMDSYSWAIKMRYQWSLSMCKGLAPVMVSPPSSVKEIFIKLNMGPMEETLKSLLLHHGMPRRHLT